MYKNMAAVLLLLSSFSFQVEGFLVDDVRNFVVRDFETAWANLKVKLLLY